MVIAARRAPAQATAPAGGRFIFGATGPEAFSDFQIKHAAGDTGAFSVSAREHGRTITPDGDFSANLANLTPTQKWWVRVVYDGTSLQAYAQNSASEPASWTAGHQVYESSDIAVLGGRMGFMGVGQSFSLIDDLTVRTDRDLDGDGVFETTGVLEHTDTFTLDGSGYSDSAIGHDRAGNLLRDDNYFYSYDAWNRLTKIEKATPAPGSPGSSPGSLIAQFTYDGLGRRIVKHAPNRADRSATEHFYYDGQSIIELRNGSDQVTKQFVWANLAGAYIDELVQVGVNLDPWNADEAGTGGFTENACDRFFYALTDANFNVIGLTTAAGLLVERYEYTPYGERTVFSHGILLGDLNGDGFVGAGDQDILSSRWGQSDADAQIADLNGDGTVGAGDLDILSAQWNAQSGAASDPWVSRAQFHSAPVPYAASAPGSGGVVGRGPALCEIGHQGLYHDELPGGTLVYNRTRMLHPRLGKFMQRDILHYVDGMNFYEYLGSNVHVRVDPQGTYIVGTIGGIVGIVGGGIILAGGSPFIGGAFILVGGAMVLWDIYDAGNSIGQIPSYLQRCLNQRNKVIEELTGEDLDDPDNRKRLKKEVQNSRR